MSRTLGNVDAHARTDPLDRASQSAQQLSHGVDVEDLRDFGERRRALGEQRRSHQLQRTVLGSGHANRASKPRTADDAQAIPVLHRGMVCRLGHGPCTGRRSATPSCRGS